MMMNLILCRGNPARVNKGWQGVWNRSDAGFKVVFWEMRAFSVCARETKMRARKPNETNLKPPAFASPKQPRQLWKNDWRYCHQRPGAQRLTFTVPSSHGQRDDLMNHTYQGARWCPYGFFFLCVCVSQCVSVLETLNRFTWYQCWLKTNPVFWRLCPWMWQSRGACLCNMVFTFASLFGCIVRQG